MPPAPARIETTVFDSETVRARLGYAFDNVLLYGTGGWAWSSNQYIRTQLTGTLNLATAGTDEAVNNYLSGWTAGGGVAFAFAQNWNVFAEYRHTSFGSSTITLPFSQLSTTSKTDVSEIDFGVNYKFDWSAPAGAGSAVATKLGTAGTGAGLQGAPRAPDAYDWTGVYIGGDGGYGWETSSGTLTDAAGVPLTPYNYGVTGPFAGAFIGGNYQFNRFVVGVEGDWQWSNLIGNSQASFAVRLRRSAPSPEVPLRSPRRSKTTARFAAGSASRLIASWSSARPAGRGAILRPPMPCSDAAPFVTNGGNSSGWTAGAGLDYAFTNNVFGRIEYRYTSLGTPSFVNVATNSADAGNRVPISDIRAGIAYKFGM